jgi:ABC-type dipeptide/oligopeptide/nickel transport system ATPase component/ABC-type dipeptide/oligopeptide/nickel transport system permease subunit
MARSRKPLPVTLVAGLALAGILVAIAIVAPFFLTDAATQVTSAVREGPSAEHWFGTDALGRDILARALVATRLTLVMATAATAMAVVAGTVIGGGVWLLPRRGRDAVLRIIDSTVAFPALVLGLVIAAILGPGAVSAVLAIGIAGIPSFARLAANMTGGVIYRDYVVASRLVGVGGWALIRRHVLPNLADSLLMLATSSFALTMLDISGLSFVGLGVQSPEFDYGRVLNESLSSIYVQPWGTVAPAAMITMAGVAIMLIGDGLAARSGARRRPKRATASGGVLRGTGIAAPHAVLEVSNLSVTAPSGAALVNGVSFAVREGEVLGLVGESGSGKSTTAMAIAGLLADGLRAEAQTLRLADLDLLGSPPARRLARDIGVIYQDPVSTFNPSLRMGTQLSEVARVHLGMSRSRAREAIADALASVRIREPRQRLRQHPFELSGGMLQRSAIAAAMTTTPKLLIADEPTTALDVTVQAEVLRQFQAVNREQGTAILFISHDLGVVREVCHRVLVLRDGRVVEELTAEQLRTGSVEHPYTRELLDATPRLELPARLPDARQEARA